MSNGNKQPPIIAPIDLSPLHYRFFLIEIKTLMFEIGVVKDVWSLRLEFFRWLDIGSGERSMKKSTRGSEILER